MNKLKTNFIVEVLAFLAFIAMASTGLLMRYVLVRGYESRLIYGRNVDLRLFGLARHQYRDLHMTLGIILVGLLTAHIALHWKQVISMLNQTLCQKPLRTFAVVVFVIICLFLLALPFVAHLTVNK